MFHYIRYIPRCLFLQSVFGGEVYLHWIVFPSIIFRLLGSITGVLNLFFFLNFIVNLEFRKDYFEDMIMQNSLVDKVTAGSKLQF